MGLPGKKSVRKIVECCPPKSSPRFLVGSAQHYLKTLKWWKVVGQVLDLDANLTSSLLAMWLWQTTTLFLVCIIIYDFACLNINFYILNKWTIKMVKGFFPSLWVIHQLYHICIKWLIQFFIKPSIQTLIKPILVYPEWYLIQRNCYSLVI